MLICVRWEKSMCLAAKGRLQGWAAKLLLLWVGIFYFFSFQICNHVTDVSFFWLAYNGRQYDKCGTKLHCIFKPAQMYLKFPNVSTFTRNPHLLYCLL